MNRSSTSIRGGLARFLLAGLVISFVATQVPWDDRVSGPDGAWRVRGELLGSWTAAEVAFRPEGVSDIPDDWRGPVEDALRSGEEVLLSRGGGIEWEPGLLTALGGLRVSSVLGVVAAVLGGFFFGVTRWWRLLSLCGVRTPYWTVARLTMLGMFFNLVVPGLTGGDVVKAGLAAKQHPGGRARAVMAVGLDRVIGFWALLMIALISSLAMREELAVLLGPLAVLAAGLSSAIFVFVHPGFRRALLEGALGRLLPKRLSGLFDALRSISGRPGEFLIASVLSVGNHVCIGLAVLSVARGMGDETSFLGCLAATVVASAVSAVPIAPGGWGVGEAAYAAMFSLLGSGEAVGFAISVSYRLCQTAISLVCGAALWRGGRDDWVAEAGNSDVTV